MSICTLVELLYYTVVLLQRYYTFMDTPLILSIPVTKLNQDKGEITKETKILNTHKEYVSYLQCLLVLLLLVNEC